MHPVPFAGPSRSRFLTLLSIAGFACTLQAAEPGLLFHLSGDHGTAADFSAAGTPSPTFQNQVGQIPDGAVGGALQCENLQLLAYRAPGNIYAQRGTLSFFWRSRYPVGPTEFPIFRVGYADHSSWDMVFLRIDYNGQGFDAFVTDASLSRTRVSARLSEFPAPKTWTHLAFAWDENRGVRLYINGKLAAQADTKARYDLALDQFGPHSRIISPYQVQSDYNFVRGGDIDEVRIHDHMLTDEAVAALARAQPLPNPTPATVRSLSAPAIREEWYFRYGWTGSETPPALPEGKTVTIRKVEIHNAYDLKRWWWKATDGIRETTWPGVYNRSRLPGRNDYFQLPDWDCYVESGKSVTFSLPNEPWNHVQISGAAWGHLELLSGAPDLENAHDAPAERILLERSKGIEQSAHRLQKPIRGRAIRFTNAEQEQPIGELAVFHVAPGDTPTGARALTYTLQPADGTVGSAARSELEAYIDGRFPADERAKLLAAPGTAAPTSAPRSSSGLPIAHVLVENTWDELPDAGLDGIALDLPPFRASPTHGEFIAFNVQVKDPLWPGRAMMDFAFSVRPNEARRLWLDLRDRVLPLKKPLWVTISSSSGEFSQASLVGAEISLVFKSREAARIEHEIDRFTQVRDVYAMLVEERPGNSRLDMYNRYLADITDLLRVNPDHPLGRQYAFAGIRGPLPGTRKPDYTAPVAPSGVPEWAFRQVTLLGQVKRFVTWYIDHRQAPYGDFGGGISDDSDLLNIWPGVALMGSVPEKVTTSVAALLDAAYRNGMVTRGLPTIQTDELHTYEEGINTLAQVLLLEHGSPRQLERAMETARSIESITGINTAGHRHIRSSYYSGTRVAEDEPWGFSKPYSFLVLQVPQTLVEYNGNPRTRSYLIELADGLLAHHKPGSRTPSVPAIRFSDDKEETVGRGWYPSHVFWGAYQFSGDRKYLAPLLEHPSLFPYLNANTVDLLGLRPALEAAPPASGHAAWQVTGDKVHLERLYASQIETCTLQEYINTSGSLWTDRVSVPTADLQRARLGGIALVRNSLYPGHVISWRFAAPANDQSVAVLVPHSTPTEFKVIAYNLETFPVTASMTGWNVDPGLWEITQGIDSDNDDAADQAQTTRSALFERSRSLEFTLPPRTTTVLTLKRRSAGTPYWSRPDLGIDREDITVQSGSIRVRVHSLGSANAPATTVALRDSSGRTIATAELPALPAPLDLLPKTEEVTLTVPAGVSLSGTILEINPNHEFEEITSINNRVKLP